ncbi:hypothetical protein B0H14DRAFT_2583160 [Mycena olivaceomarginata]|nr:hypothetical protein B0H14DRAFT_2583160 [Mycena olivaceomarginata]
MPFPDLSHVAFTRSGETTVPKLNNYQRSWILDVGIRNLDLPSLSGKSAATAYNKVKDEAFQAKAFQHTVQPGDREEESCIPALVADWKVKNPKKNKDRDGAKDGDVADSDQEEDEGVRVGMLRGYTKAGWRVAMQKVISNKRSAKKSKLKTKMDDADDRIPDAPASVLAKLLGLGAYTGRDKFRDDHHDEIHEYSKTFKGTMNAGGKFRRAEKLLRQQLVATGFKHMVNSLHASSKFRPAEGVPENIHVRQSFQLQYAQPFQAVVNSMYEWAEKPLKDYLATREDSAKAPGGKSYDVPTPPFGGHVAARCSQYVHHMSPATGRYVVMDWPLCSIANSGIVLPPPPGGQLRLRLVLRVMIHVPYSYLYPNSFASGRGLV